MRCELTGCNGGYIRLLGYTPETESNLERERQEYATAYRTCNQGGILKQLKSKFMDTENLNKWWYSLPEEIRKKLYVQEGTDVWNDLDMSARVAMFRYCRMKIFG